MVRHHVKGKRKTSSKNIEAAEKKKESLLKNLDRFAGSSEEEGSNEDTDDESIDSNANVGQLQEDVDEKGDRPSANDSSSDEDEYGDPTHNQTRLVKEATNSDSYDDPDDDSDDDFSEQTNRGMPGAMARILGITAPTRAKQTKGIVLSKTFTPLQKQQKKEKEQQDALKLKRKQRREVNLTALHIPLSAATSRPIMGKDKGFDMIAESMSKEIEVESMHRRVATRGVVALFNTIAQHQQQRAQQQTSSGLSAKKNEDVKSMSKHGFLDMLKKGSSKSDKSTDKSTASSGDNKKKVSKEGWGALKDDFMMNSKREDLTDGDDSDTDVENDRKRGADDDDVMDDDWSSDDDATPMKKQKLAS